jgi:ATP-dependent RNA helicase DDX20
MLQRRRMGVMDAARAFRVRVLVSTDLNARGLDLPSVNLVVNVDLPASDATYLHRVGRTGRFGTSGVAVSLVTRNELELLQARPDLLVCGNGHALRLF